jgi:hypothetical protein
MVGCGSGECGGTTATTGSAFSMSMDAAMAVANNVQLRGGTIVPQDEPKGTTSRPTGTDTKPTEPPPPPPSQQICKASKVISRARVRCYWEGDPDDEPAAETVEDKLSASEADASEAATIALENAAKAWCRGGNCSGELKECKPEYGTDIADDASLERTTSGGKIKLCVKVTVKAKVNCFCKA